MYVIMYVCLYLDVLLAFEDEYCFLKNTVLKYLLNLEKRYNLLVTYFESMCEFENR